MARISLVIDQETFDSTNTDFTPVPVGPYEVTIYEVNVAEVKNGDNKGKPRVNIQFRIKDGETAPDGTKQSNRRLFSGINWFYGKSKKDGSPTLPFEVVALAKALGLTTESLLDLDTDDLLGEELIVNVEHREAMTKESGYTESFNPARWNAEIKSYRSISSAAASAAASTKVTNAGGAAKVTYAL